MTARPPKPNLDAALSHWGWAVPILLLAAALSLPQIELYPPTPDEFFSMLNTGWLVNGPYSPADVIASLRLNSPDQTPGYFILLSIWGSLSAYDLALGRVLTIFTALLALAMIYRAARDFIAPLGGLLALIVAISSAFFNFYYAHTRMYPLFVFAAAAVLWCYLRMMHRQQAVKTRDYLALSSATFALISIHAFSVTFLLALGIYHLLIAPKNARWRRVSAAILAAGLLFAPYLLVLAAEIGDVVESKAPAAADGIRAAQAWLVVTFNSQPLLLLISAAGLALGARQKKIALRRWLALPPLFLLVIALLAQLTPLIAEKTMRYQLDGWLPFLLFTAAGLYALHCFRRWLCLLALLWVIAGLVFQNSADWGQYLSGRDKAFPVPPTQVISRLALQSETPPLLIAYRYFSVALDRPRGIGLPQRDYYFGRHGIPLKVFDELARFEEFMAWQALTEPLIWVFYQTSKTNAQQADEFDAMMNQLHYQPCETIAVGVDTVIVQYFWKTFGCQPAPPPHAAYQTANIDYAFYGAVLDSAAAKLVFSDRWTARDAGELADYKLSHQLLTAEWDKVAQLDLHLAHPGQPRQLSIDLADVPAGTYRLMAILYDEQSGTKAAWLNASDPADMLTLTEITIP